MDEARQERFRSLIAARLAEIDREDALGETGQSVVTLDQQSVGRLSRVDALQNQAMARAQAGRRRNTRVRLMAALARLEAGEFGWCEECGGEIGARRLALDPAALTCIDCARG